MAAQVNVASEGPGSVVFEEGNILERLAYPDDTFDVIYSSQVFGHLPGPDLPVRALIEIRRVLKPGGLFRLSLPDYNFDVYRERTLRKEDGTFLFDPDGGGFLSADGEIVWGGHLWFPTIAVVRDVIESSPFAGGANYLQYNRPDGTAMIGAVEYSKGYVARSAEHDSRVANRSKAVSIIVDSDDSHSIA